MGMATQTDQGLSVTVIRNAEGRDLWSLAAEVKRLADAARAGKASREELSGSTITISSLGPMGGIASTPVINRPEVAIVAVNKVRESVVVIDGELEVRKLMNLSLSLRPPRRRRLGRGQFHAGSEEPDRESAEAALDALSRLVGGVQKMTLIRWIAGCLLEGRHARARRAGCSGHGAGARRAGLHPCSGERRAAAEQRDAVDPLRAGMRATSARLSWQVSRERGFRADRRRWRAVAPGKRMTFA